MQRQAQPRHPPIPRRQAQPAVAPPNQALRNQLEQLQLQRSIDGERSQLALLPPPQRRLRFTLNRQQLITLKANWPGYEFTISPQATPHSHPILSFERSEVETIMVADAINYMAGALPNPQQHFIVDIGGNAKRHANRPFIHSCCPILMPSDAVRNAKYAQLGPNVGRYCTCKAEDCWHTLSHHYRPQHPQPPEPQHWPELRPALYLSIHSLYYLSLDTIVQLVYSTVLGLLIASVHEFPDALGCLGSLPDRSSGGEAQYLILPGGQVRMTTQGNSSPYQHSACDWLRFGHYSDAQGRGISWAATRKYANTIVYTFSVSPNFPNIAPLAQVDLFNPTLLSPDHYGPISLAGAATKNTKTVNAAFEAIDVSESLGTTVFSRFKDIIFDRPNHPPLFVPKGLIAELSDHISPHERTTSTYKSLLVYARNLTAKYNVPVSMRSDCIIAAACIAFTKDLLLKSTTVERMWDDPNIERWNKAIQREPTDVPFVTQAALAGAGCLTLTATYVSIRNWKRSRTEPGMMGPILTALVVGCYLVGKYIYMQWRKPKTGFIDLGKYNLDHHSIPMSQGIATISPTSLNSRETTTVPVEPAKNAKLIKTDNEVTNIRPILQAHSIVDPTRMPVVYAGGNSYNEEIALSNRILMHVNKPPIDGIYWQNYRNWVLDNFDHLFPQWQRFKTNKPPHDILYHRWNDRFPGHIREIHNRALNELQTTSVPLERIYHKDMFVKVEKYMNSSVGDLVDKDPRPITSCSPHYNVLVGPEVFWFSNCLKKMWSHLPNFDNHIVYVCGYNAEGAGVIFDETGGHTAVHLNNYSIDGKRYDAHMQEPHQALERDIMAMIGVSKRVINYMSQAEAHVGHTKTGHKYKASSGRGSGTPPTSACNSLHRGLSINYAIFCDHNLVFDDNSRIVVGQFANFDVVQQQRHQRITNYNRFAGLYHNTDNKIMPDVNLPDYKSQHGDANVELHVLVNGDDIAIRTNLHLNPQNLIDITYTIGIEDEWRYHAFSHSLTFCSGYFWPTEDGCVFGPRVGRCLLKAGWAVDVPKADWSYARGVALGNKNTWSFILPLHGINSLILAITAKTKARPIKEHKILADLPHKPNTENFAMLQYLYGWDLSHSEQLLRLLTEIKSLPMALHMDIFDTMYAVDVDEILLDGDMVWENHSQFLICDKCHLEDPFCTCREPIADTEQILSSLDQASGNPQPLSDPYVALSSAIVPSIMSMLGRSAGSIVTSEYGMLYGQDGALNITKSVELGLHFLAAPFYEELVKTWIPAFNYIIPAFELIGTIVHVARTGQPIHLLGRIPPTIMHMLNRSGRRPLGRRILSHFLFNAGAVVFLPGVSELIATSIGASAEHLEGIALACRFFSFFL